jgi:SAM-dependent methyltransferase
MDIKFLSFLKDPFTKEDLIFHNFSQNDSNLIDGLFLNLNTKTCFPLENGVPIFIKNSFSDNFLLKYKNQISELEKSLSFKLNLIQGTNSWSFSSEWEAHFEKDLKETWGWTVEQRFEQLLLEMEISKIQLNKLTVLDAGCGNGMLTERVSNESEFTFGVDYSDSVFYAENKRKSTTVCFIKADLRYLPFGNDFFDLIFSNGVIHHTDNTQKTFNLIATHLKKEGKFYIWLYSQKGTFSWKIKRKIYDYIRLIVCRLPSSFQKAIVNFLSSTFSMFLKNKKIDDIRIDMYDSITPRWRFYHTPEEVAQWYYQQGFGPITLTHFDNRYGFGVLGTKIKMEKTPGENFR